MVLRCCVKNCKEVFKKGGSVTSHKFPKNPSRQKAWIEQIGEENLNIKSYSRICSKHFKDDCIDRNKFGGTWLKSDALPSKCGQTTCYTTENCLDHHNSELSSSYVADSSSLTPKETPVEYKSAPSSSKADSSSLTPKETPVEYKSAPSSSKAGSSNSLSINQKHSFISSSKDGTPSGIKRCVEGFDKVIFPAKAKKSFTVAQKTVSAYQKELKSSNQIVKRLGKQDEPDKNNEEDSDKEICDIIDTTHRKNSEECSDVNDESDDQEVKERICCKKRKVGSSSSSSSERESRSSSVRKFVSSSSENKLKNSSFSVKKFQSSSSLERKFQNSSSATKKVHSNISSEKKIQKPSSVLKKSQNPSPSFRKIPNASSLHKKIPNSSQSLKNVLSGSSSEKKVSTPSNYEKRRKSSSSSERELDTSSIDREMKNQLYENHFENQSSEKDTKNSFPAAKEANINSYERELFDASFSGKEFDVTEKESGQKSVDREDIFGRYVACELRALRCHPLIYLQTKQSILESLNSANFELLNPE